MERAIVEERTLLVMGRLWCDPFHNLMFLLASFDSVNGRLLVH